MLNVHCWQMPKVILIDYLFLPIHFDLFIIVLEKKIRDAQQKHDIWNNES